MARLCDRAVILRRFRYGETSLVLQLLSREHGRVHLLAKGAYRPTARFYAALDLFDTLELEWIASPGRELATLQSASIVVRRHRLALDLARFRAALTMLELADHGCQDGPANHELFELTSAGLDQLLQIAARELGHQQRERAVQPFAMLRRGDRERPQFAVRTGVGGLIQQGLRLGFEGGGRYNQFALFQKVPSDG